MLNYSDIDDYGTLILGCLQILCITIFIFNILNITTMKLKIIHEHLCQYWLYRLMTLTPLEGKHWVAVKEYGHTYWYEVDDERPQPKISHTAMPDGTTINYFNN